ncbi:hypothetical protein BC831DRAFT_497409 [Entophlyctis helioformis]|nr:hypothetical protein BC831DRAFT_497409 [Entophlyctis helioformis]
MPLQPQYGVPPAGGQAAPAASAAVNRSAIQEKIQSIVAENRLSAWYADPARINHVMGRLFSIDWSGLGRSMRINSDLVYDFCSLALYDIVFFVDDSGSMAFEEGGERITDLEFILSRTAEIATQFDDDGISVVFMNNNLRGDNIRTGTQVADLIKKVNFTGMTPLGTEFNNRVLQRNVIPAAMSGNLGKPVLAIIITDGEPTKEPRDALGRSIAAAMDALSRTRYGSGALAVQIGQVGTDQKAQQFLASMDQDPVFGRMVDVTSNYEMESEEFARKGVPLTPETWLLKLCVGAIDRSYDDAD